jgi:hypothetical protein
MAVTIEELVRLENNLHTADIPFTITSHRFVLPSGIIIYLVVVRFNDPHYSIIQSLISTAILTYDYIIYTAAQLHSFRSGRYNVFFLDAFDHITSYVYSESNTNLCYQSLLELNQNSLKQVVGKGLFNSLHNTISH